MVFNLAWFSNFIHHYGRQLLLCIKSVEGRSYPREEAKYFI